MISWVEVFQVLYSSTLQATLSAILSLALGFFVALGLLQQKNRKFVSIAEGVLLAPQVLPPLFLLLAFFKFFSFFDEIPSGFWGVVCLHVFINFGFASLQLKRLLQSKVGGFAELAQTEGASALLFFKTVLTYLKKDLQALFFTVFVFCFMSFSIPVVMGGLGSETLEVLIYKKMQQAGAMNWVLGLSLIQFLILSLLGFYWRQSQQHVPSQARFYRFDYGSSHGLFSGLLVMLFFWSLMLSGLWPGVQELFSHEILKAQLPSALWGSLLLSLSTGFFTLIFLFSLAYYWPQEKLSQILFVATTPSAVLIGLWFFALGWPAGDSSLHFLLTGGLLSALFFFSIYRFGAASELEGLTQSVKVSASMGASRFFTFRWVSLPRLVKPFFFLAGLASLWGVGEFALSLFLLTPESHMTLLVKMLISRYRIEMAIAVMWMAVLQGLILFYFYRKVGHVLHQRLN